MADALSRIREERLSDVEAEELLETVPIIPGEDTIIRVFEEKEEDKRPEKLAPHTMSSAAMKAVFDNLTSGAGRRAEQEYDTGSAAHLEADAIEVNMRSARVSTQMHITDWAEAQQEDPEIEPAMDWCCLNKKKSLDWTAHEVKVQLTLSGGLLYYQHKPNYQLEEVKQFIVLQTHRRMAIDGCHQDAGHQGKKRTENLISGRFWWPGVYEDVDRAVKNCRHCQLYGGKEGKAPMVPMMVTTPLQLVHINLTLFETTTNLNESPKIENVLVIDAFMRSTRAYVTKDQKASMAARILYEGFISIFGAPERILTDQSKAFTSEVVEQLCSQFRISQLTITAYHHHSNGQVE